MKLNDAQKNFLNEAFRSMLYEEKLFQALGPTQKASLIEAINVQTRHLMLKTKQYDSKSATKTGDEEVTKMVEFALVLIVPGLGHEVTLKKEMPEMAIAGVTH